MYLAELRFHVIQDTDFTAAEQAIRNYIEALIFNGQVLGREFPTAWQAPCFCSRIVIPAEDALLMQYHSLRGKAAMQALTTAGLGYPQLQILGMDLMSQHSSQTAQPEGYILFCTFSDNCSPLRCIEQFAPVPLYQLKTTPDDDFETLLRWQIQYQALDEIQMQQQRVLIKSAENSLQQFNSRLNRQGRRLARQLAEALQQPVYYALYSGSSRDCATESEKRCPGCRADWRLPQTWHSLFDFRCDSCLLLSNIAWECQR